MAQRSVQAGRIGPNAINQLAAVLGERVGAGPLKRLFETAGIAGYLEAMPADMVDEAEVRRLHAALRREFGPACARSLARAAGRRTADFLLDRRIPGAVQWIMPRLPRPLAVRLLLRLSERKSWAFAGSGVFVAVYGRPSHLGITGNPLCRGLISDGPACDYHVGTIEALFQALVHPEVKVREVSCEATGSPACVFELDW